MSDYPSADELLIAHATMEKMQSAAYREHRDHPERWGSGFGDQWGAWVEAKRQIAIATNSLIETPDDEYAKAWERMVDGE